MVNWIQMLGHIITSWYIRVSRKHHKFVHAEKYRYEIPADSRTQEHGHAKSQFSTFEALRAPKTMLEYFVSWIACLVDREQAILPSFISHLRF